MAKKVRRKLEEEEAAAFEFPVFDEPGFATKEFEVTWGLAFAGLITVLLGILGWALSVANVNGWVPFGLGILGIVATPLVLRRIRARAALYTKGDWAGLIMMEFFGWLALWFVLLNISPHAV